LEVELTPQWHPWLKKCALVGAGFLHFYTATGVGISVAEGKEIKVFDGRE